MTILSYSGYQGSIEYEDGQLVIQLLHVDDFITTACASAEQAEAAFHELVDDYLATCAETGRPPDKPYKGSLNIRMSPELHRQAAKAAAVAGISLNAWIVGACETALSRPPRGRTAAAGRDRVAPPRGTIVDLAALRQRNKQIFERERAYAGRHNG